MRERERERLREERECYERFTEEDSEEARVLSTFMLIMKDCILSDKI